MSTNITNSLPQVRNVGAPQASFSIVSGRARQARRTRARAARRRRAVMLEVRFFMRSCPDEGLYAGPREECDFGH
ncbi:MAG: hypothetical protein AUI47_03635 [Acidobacteria bacterium 13_1_40CM_2_68_5]|nr:MAG: hypothetical protein AUI47_03635 [Acidobacteria bacterium 13_1_40CM_2_68_5]OLE67477.1 MAG: hypothetical protein AUG09_02245 [Acidobacteria bacterium 13_1_20CM_2_68_7]